MAWPGFWSREFSSEKVNKEKMLSRSSWDILVHIYQFWSVHPATSLSPPPHPKNLNGFVQISRLITARIRDPTSVAMPMELLFEKHFAIDTDFLDF